MVISLLVLFAGIAILIAGAEALVRGASSIAKRWGVSSLVIGLTVVAFGTSAPEMVVNILSAINNTTDLAVGNVVGSNMANILLILGIGATIRGLTVTKGTTYKEIPFALLAMILVWIMGNDLLLDAGLTTSSVLSRSEGLVLLSFFIIFLYYTYGISKVSGEDGGKVDVYSWPISLLLFVLGLGALILSGKWIVDSAVVLASAAGLSEGLIGLTIIAIGTSLPELATTIAAVRKGHTDIAIGNVIGSNIFNVFWILGITAVIKPLPFTSTIGLDVVFTTIATVLLFLFMFVGKKQILDRWQGIFFVLLYVGYIAFAILR